MVDDARHQARREQLEILSSALCAEPPQEGEQPIALSALHVIVLMMSMAHTLDQCEGREAGRLERARALGMQLLLDGGESQAAADVMLKNAIDTLQAESQWRSGESPDPAVSRAWLDLLEEEVSYLRSIMRA